MLRGTPVEALLRSRSKDYPNIAVSLKAERESNMPTNPRETVLAIALMLWPISTSAQGLPTREGTCVYTRIAQLQHRLQSGENGPFVPDSGSAVRFDNGGYQVSYEELDTVRHSRKGDPVLMCLIRIPKGCPPGDARGRIYTTTNLRTMESWTMSDSEHGCGGA
jgi:hypothetical protein